MHKYLLLHWTDFCQHHNDPNKLPPLHLHALALHIASLLLEQELYWTVRSLFQTWLFSTTNRSPAAQTFTNLIGPELLEQIQTHLKIQKAIQDEKF